MIQLSVNLNKIALLRNSREGDYPSVLQHARTCIKAGANGITVHPRPDQRHIRPSDVRQLAALLKDTPTVEFNIEGNPFAPAVACGENSYPGLLALVAETCPQQCTLVPDSNDQLTSDHGFNLHKDGERLQPIIAALHQQKCRVSLFMDPDLEQIRLANALGADRIELYTGPYAAACHQTGSSAAKKIDALYQQYHEAATLASQLGLGVNAGHDLNLINLPRFVTLPGLLEVSIGHAFIVDALAMGLVNTTKAYLNCLQ